MKKADAIIALYPNVAKVENNEIAYDAEGNAVVYDEATVQAYMDSKAYIAKRQAEYPSFIDYLDGVVKGDQAQIDKYIADCQAVKAKYPKG